MFEVTVVKAITMVKAAIFERVRSQTNKGVSVKRVGMNNQLLIVF